MSHDPYAMKSPCCNCPFRSDVRPYLNSERVREIEQSLDQGGFPCHKTTRAGGASGKAEVQCAGHLILLEKLGRPSNLMRVMERLRAYDHTKLDMAAPVYDSFDEMAEAQEI
jgi:hypothetical protein